MESSKKILTNCDVLESIFRYLDFKEHLKLIKICPQFEDAIVHGVWRSKCKNLHILQKFPYTFLLDYNAVNNVMTESSLTPVAIHIILHHASMYIHKLDLICIRCLENTISLKYHHLTEVILRCTVVEDTHLQQVAKNCINLQSITLINFTDSKNQSNIRANVFGEMKALNKLDIVDRDFTAWNYFDVQQLFCLAHLKTLNININISNSNDNKGNNNNSTDRVYNIENLTIETLPYLQYANVFIIKDLIGFENLTKLSITFNKSRCHDLRDNDLIQINNACSKLCELSFADCYFNFNELPLMNNLKHLTFRRCRGIKHKNFDDIFRKFKLKSLSLVDSRVTDMVQHINGITDSNYMSNTLETLTIEYIYDVDIAIIFCYRQHKFENVSKIRVLQARLPYTELREFCFSHNFPNLKELIMDSFHISSEDILYLEHLKVLQFDLFYYMSWSYLEILFKHPTLTHITIRPFQCREFNTDYYDRSSICCEGLTTTLEYLSLPSVVYESALNFWRSFRQRNKLLKLEIVDCDTLKRRAVPTL